MKILYAIQGTGNGHISRAKDILPHLQKYGTVDILFSGQQTSVELHYPIKYHYKGLSFFFGTNGGIDYLKTFNKNSVFKFFKEIYHCPVKNYDLVINDFEPISAWACKFKKVKAIALSHQAALLSENVPKPKHKDFMGLFILKYYAPCSISYSFHFKSYNPNIFTPIIRSTIRNKENMVKKHYTVYLPAYDNEKITKVLSKFEDTSWEVFSKQTKSPYEKNNLKFYPIKPDLFEKSICSCKGVICGAGFETPAEALFLKKKLLVIPMKNQYEQHYNAIALKEMGVTVIKSLKKKNVKVISKWLNNDAIVKVHYEDETAAIIENLILEHSIK